MAYNNSNNNKGKYQGTKPHPGDDQPKINTRQAASELQSRFSDVTRGIRDNRKGTKLYDWQVEFTYCIDQIMRGPSYIAPKFVSITHHLINMIDSDVKNVGFKNDASIKRK